MSHPTFDTSILFSAKWFWNSVGCWNMYNYFREGVIVGVVWYKIYIYILCNYVILWIPQAVMFFFPGKCEHFWTCVENWFTHVKPTSYIACVACAHVVCSQKILQNQQNNLGLRFISLSSGSTDVGRESNQEVIAVVVCLFGLSRIKMAEAMFWSSSFRNVAEIVQAWR